MLAAIIGALGLFYILEVVYKVNIIEYYGVSISNNNI
jgi:hypothetical protein